MANRFDARGVREAWDTAADAYATGQASGRDYFRYDFFGPAQIELCGEVAGTQLLDVGCGSGYFSRAMADRGATVTGIDISPKMIEHARATGGAITYEVLDAMEIANRFAPGSFDLATACLALQDMPDPASVLRAIHHVVRPGGRLIFSIEHPCTNTAYRQWERDRSGHKLYLCIDRYYERGPIPYTWKRWAYEFTTQALHVTLEDWFTWIINAGFSLRAFREPVPTPEAVNEHPLLDDATRIPFFAMFDLVRPQ